MIAPTGTAFATTELRATPRAIHQERYTKSDTPRTDALWKSISDVPPQNKIEDSLLAKLQEFERENEALRKAIELALEYWQHRQQRYKNRRPAWVEVAEAAIKEKANG